MDEKSPHEKNLLKVMVFGTAVSFGLRISAFGFRPSDFRAAGSASLPTLGHSAALPLWHFLQPNSPILHLPAVRFQPDRTGRRNFHRVLQHFPIAGAMRNAVFHRNLNLVPILGFVLLEVFIRTGHEIIPALQLWLANEDAAVCVHLGAELQLENEILRKLA